MVAPSNIDLKIIVVENDGEGLSEDIITTFSSKNNIRITYFLETRQGLAFARNRAVREANGCDFCCFIDDDQTVNKDFLIELLRCQYEYNADGVSSSCVPLFSNKVPKYIRYFHTRKIHTYGTIIDSANTGGLLIKKRCLDMIDGPFDIRFNFSGCEDIYLTSQISKFGGIIRFQPKAIVYENIPEHRTTLRYVINRSFSDSNADYFVQSIRSNRNFKLKALPRLSMRLLYGLLILLPFLILGKSNRLKGLIKIVHSLGGFSFIFGNNNQFYKSSVL